MLNTPAWNKKPSYEDLEKRIKGVEKSNLRFKQERENLAETENQFKVIFDKSPHPIALTEINTGKIVEANPIFCEKVGYEKKELLGNTTTELGFYSPEDRLTFRETLLKNGRINGLEKKFETRKQNYTTKMHAESPHN